MVEKRSYEWLKVVLVFCVLFVTGARSEELKSNPDEPAAQKILAEFRIGKAGDPILLPVTFEGKEHLFLFDTGSSLMLFDISFKHQLGVAKKNVIAKTAGSPMVVEVFDPPDAFLGPVSIKDYGEVGCCDLRMPSLVLGRKIGGIIGMNFLRNYVIRMNFDEGILSFLQPVKGQYSHWGKEMVFEYDSLGCPQITGRILDGIRVDFTLDTGLDALMLNIDIFKEIISKKETKTSETLYATASGVIRRKEVRLDNLIVGPFEYRGLLLAEGNVSRLGLSFFYRHLVTFDFPNNRIYLKKGRNFEKVDETDMSGLHLLRISDEVVVYSVDEDSPAQKAGIESNDVILRVGDKDANTYDICELRRVLMSGDKHKITMTIKRADDVKELSFLLKKKI
jgi:hypothetical protein